MRRIRVIPVLLLKNGGLVKTVKFKKPKYVGDPINAIKIFNEKEVDELVFLDITATNKNRKPSLKVISEIAGECFMPLCYGGGIKTIDEIKEILNIGVEKVAINTGSVADHALIKKAANLFGNQSIVVSIDVKKNIFGKYQVYTHGGKKNTKLDPASFAVQMEENGAGEILLNSIDKDGTYHGYDIELIKKVSEVVNVPVIACGGVGKISDFVDGIKMGGASAVSAGSFFVFQGDLRAVLINYPTQEEIKNKVYSVI